MNFIEKHTRLNEQRGHTDVQSTTNERNVAQAPYLYLKLEPFVNNSAFCIALGSSGSLKKAWYSTQVFQKDLHTSRLAMENSRVSLHKGWA